MHADRQQKPMIDSSKSAAAGRKAGAGPPGAGRQDQWPTHHHQHAGFLGAVPAPHSLSTTQCSQPRVLAPCYRGRSKLRQHASQPCQLPPMFRLHRSRQLRKCSTSHRPLLMPEIPSGNAIQPQPPTQVARLRWWMIALSSLRLKTKTTRTSLLLMLAMARQTPPVEVLPAATMMTCLRTIRHLRRGLRRLRRLPPL